MLKNIIINTENEDSALITDKWVLGTGMSTGDLCLVHTAIPLMIIQYPVNAPDDDGKPSCTVYAKGKIDPDTFDKLFAEAWSIIEIYKDRYKEHRTDLQSV
ncbi:MAG: hypothetical protein KDI11_06710 [Alphaproteobacteria bacterium]|nr:hypothetical protein [Alphaproteobacteria bacterium]